MARASVTARHFTSAAKVAASSRAAGATNPTDVDHRRLGLVSETGRSFFIAGGANFTGDGEELVGNVSTNGNELTGAFRVVRLPNYMFPDRSTVGGGFLRGQIVERVLISGALTVYTDSATSDSGGATFVSQLSLAFSSVYNRPSSLATIASTFAVRMPPPDAQSVAASN